MAKRTRRAWVLIAGSLFAFTQGALLHRHAQGAPYHSGASYSPPEQRRTSAAVGAALPVRLAQIYSSTGVGTATPYASRSQVQEWATNTPVVPQGVYVHPVSPAYQPLIPAPVVSSSQQYTPKTREGWTGSVVYSPAEIGASSGSVSGHYGVEALGRGILSSPVEIGARSGSISRRYGVEAAGEILSQEEVHRLINSGSSRTQSFIDSGNSHIHGHIQNAPFVQSPPVQEFRYGAPYSPGPAPRSYNTPSYVSNYASNVVPQSGNLPYTGYSRTSRYEAAPSESGEIENLISQINGNVSRTNSPRTSLPGVENISELDSLVAEIEGKAPKGLTPVIVRRRPSESTREAPVSSLGFEAPDPSQVLDMTDSDGSLRACYGNGGIARQAENLEYYCDYNEQSRPDSHGDLPPVGTHQVLPLEASSSYDGVSNDDQNLRNCLQRGGTRVRLPNSKWACAM